MTVRDHLRRAFRFLLPLLYGRSRFKLFLKTSLGDIDLRLQQLASVADFFSGVLRPVRIQAPFGESMLVVAPHQDDETIGCGGAMALQRRTGRAVSIVVLNDGAIGHDDLGMERQELERLRNEESRRAAAVLDIPAPSFLGHADLQADAVRIAEEVAEILRSRKIDVVFTPFVLDTQPDHRRANYIVAEALRKVDWNIRVLGYEVWGFCIPNVIVAIDEVMELKLRALACFEFANRAVNYTWSTQGVNMYRSRFTEVGVCRYAECFFEAPREEFIALVEKVQAAEAGAGPAIPDGARQ